MIPISEPLIAKNALKYIQDCLKTGWVSSAGDYVEKFENAFAKYLGVRYAVATSTGTASLHLALASLNIGKGDEVVVPAFTMIASVLPVLYLGATPVLVDSELETGNIDTSKIEEKITKKTKAILPVHIFGHPVDMDPILGLAKKYNLVVIEDAAEAHGAEYYSKTKKKWMKTGSVGNIGCFSFYGNKIITTGEGGMAVTNDKTVADKMRSLRNLARIQGKHFLHTEVGFAYRMSNLQAALGLAELEEIKNYIEKKKNIAKMYHEKLKEIDGITLPVEKSYAKSVFWQYGLLLTQKYSVERMERALIQRGIETRRFFVPMHRQPAFKKLGFFKNQSYPIAEKLSQQGLCIPSGVALSNKELDYVCKQLKRILD